MVDDNIVQVENNITKKEFPPYANIAYLGGNLLLGGLSYVLLRQYSRFFVFLGLMFIAALLPIGATLAAWTVMIGSAIDAYFISKKLKEKKIKEPRYNGFLTWLAVIIWILMIIVALATMMSTGGVV